MQEKLVARVLELPDVTLGPSITSVPGARAFFLDYSVFEAPMFAVNEFGHIHPDFDGSLHIMVSPELCRRVAASGWGELHPRTDQVAMVYGPRDDDELETVYSIVEMAYLYSRGEAEAD
jgi:phospholipase/carboxylesterase